MSWILPLHQKYRYLANERVSKLIFRTKKAKKYIKFPWSRVSTARSVHVLRKCHSTNKIIPRDTCVTLQTKIIRDNQKSSGFANKITKIIEIWIKRSVKQFLKSKSTFENNRERERETRLGTKFHDDTHFALSRVSGKRKPGYWAGEIRYNTIIQ